MPYWRLYYHVVWATTGRMPLITADIEEKLFVYINHKCLANKAQAYAVGGMPDHIHLVAAISPAITVADCIRNIKGSSSHYITEHFGIDFSWQRGYGVFSVSCKKLETAIQYVLNQKQHHAEQTTKAALEYSTHFDSGPPEFQTKGSEE